MPRRLTKELEEAGKRMADQINARLTFGNPFELRHSIMTFRLQDGSTDGVVYDSIRDAKRHSDPMRVCYFAFLNYLGGISPRECGIYLDFHRDARNASIGQKDNEIAFLSTYGHDVYSGRLN